MPVSYAEIRGKLAEHREAQAARARREAWLRNLREPWRLLRLPFARQEPDQEIPAGDEEEEEVEEEEENPLPRRPRRMPLRTLTPREKIRTLTMHFVKAAVWLALWFFFIHIGFGAIFFIVSIIYLMYRNLGEGDRGPSAYSVFNKDCEQLQGTFTAEQFDQGMRSGYGLF